MSMTLKEILDSVLLESGLPTETSYADNDDDSIKRLMYLANRSVSTLGRHPWQALRKTYEFTLTASTSYSLPTDFRAFVPDTMYTDSHLWAVNFPTDAGEWGYLQASDGGSGVRVKARLLGNTIRIYQPNPGEEIRFEYISNYPVQSTGGTAKERFTADTDTTVLDDDLVVMDITWRYKKLVGLSDWQVDMASFREMYGILKGQDGGSQTISPCSDGMGGEPYYDLWRPVPNI